MEACKRALVIASSLPNAYGRMEQTVMPNSSVPIPPYMLPQPIYAPQTVHQEPYYQTIFAPLNIFENQEVFCSNA